MKKGQTAVAKPAKTAKPVVHHQKLTAAQHHKASVAAHKAALTRKHNAALARKHAGTGKHAARGWSPDDAVAFCSARAVAECLRLALGVSVSLRDMLGLYWRTASDADAGASILETLKAARAYGLGGFRPVTYELVRLDALREANERLIVGADCPEPHAVVAHDGFWWSWGEPYDPWTDQVSEAWAVTW